MTQKLKIILIPFLLVMSGCSYQGNLAPDDSDPYEKSNRGFFEFNEKLDEAKGKWMTIIKKTEEMLGKD